MCRSRSWERSSTKRRCASATQPAGVVLGEVVVAPVVGVVVTGVVVKGVVVAGALAVVDGVVWVEAAADVAVL